MSAIHFHVEPADDPTFVLLRTSANPNAERKPPMRVARVHLDAVLLMLIDAANALQAEGAVTC